jgi:hypothetical protein
MDPPRATFLFADHKTLPRNHTNQDCGLVVNSYLTFKTGIFKELFVSKLTLNYDFWPKTIMKIGFFAMVHRKSHKKFEA